jgi:murein L,D-transpeptidase YcbB/YkuD
MRVPLHDRLQQIIINMERSRWVPMDVKGDYVVVNIPEFKMHVYAGDELAWSSNVIVGKSNPVNKTVIFNDSLEMIVFSPHWNIPLNILTREILPEIKKNKKYLKRTNLEVVNRKGELKDPDEIDWDKYTDKFPYIIRERPGPNNSLGLVKFLFPNSYDIYMHDTPAKTLFSKTSRSFSHGCIRLQEPAKFAQHLLRDDPSWTPEKIEETMKGGTETFVKLKKKVPVFLAYFTAWVDREGRLNFAEDIYEHDKNMKRLLFSANDSSVVVIEKPSSLFRPASDCLLPLSPAYIRDTEISVSTVFLFVN